MDHVNAEAPSVGLPYHAAHLTPDPARPAVWKAVAAHLAPWYPVGGHVLELGAGYCDWINHVPGARRVAVDVWPGVQQHAAAGVEAHVLDVRAGMASLGHAAFDLVLASNVLEHLEPDLVTQVVDEVRGLLRPRGRFIAIQPNFRFAYRRYFDDYTHRSVFTDVSLPALLRARGFDIDRTSARFLPYSMRGASGLARPWLVRAYLRSPLKPLAGQMLVVARRP